MLLLQMGATHAKLVKQEAADVAYRKAQELCMRIMKILQGINALKSQTSAS